MILNFVFGFDWVASDSLHSLQLKNWQHHLCHSAVFWYCLNCQQHTVCCSYYYTSMKLLMLMLLQDSNFPTVGRIRDFSHYHIGHLGSYCTSTTGDVRCNRSRSWPGVVFCMFSRGLWRLKDQRGNLKKGSVTVAGTRRAPSWRAGCVDVATRQNI